MEACFERMRGANPGWEVVIHKDLSLAEPCDGFDRLETLQAKVDWLRICLICNTGGLWLDASTVCLESVETWLDVSERRVVGFGCPIDGEILENWAFAARAGHPLLLAWKAEFARAIAMGFDRYKLEHDPGEKIYPELPYLTMHAAYSRVHDPEQVFMRDALDEHYGPFYYQSKHNEQPTRFVATLLLFFRCEHHPPLLKMTGEQRGHATRFYHIVPVFPGSFCDMYLGLTTRPTALVLALVVLRIAHLALFPRRRS